MSDTPSDDRRTDAESTPMARRQFLAVSGLVGATSLTGIGAATTSNTAQAVAPDNRNGSTGFERFELAENGLGNAQTDTPPFCPRLTTYEGRQYYAYWTHAGKLVVAARELPDGDWTQNHTDIDIGNRDGHWTPAVGIGPDGHVFLCYNTRGSQPTWRRSENPADVTAFGPEHNGMTGQNESGANYPEFTRLRDGTLLFGYRQGGSGNGDWMLNRWNGAAEEWEPLQHPLVSRLFEGQTYNAYPWNLVQSNDGVLHYFFCWRGTGGVQTNQQLSYARSPDGGETWTRSDGTEYDLPITKGTIEVVDPIEQDSNLINQGWSAYHPETNEPHVAYYRDDADGHTQIFHAHLADGTWQVEATTDRTTDINLGGGGVVASPIGRMGIVVGDDGDVHIVTRDFQRGSWPLLVEKLDGEWQTSVLYKRNLTWSDLHIDPERWRQDRVLSFVDHQQTVGDVPWSGDALVGVSDVDPSTLHRATRTVDSWETGDELATYATTDPVETPITTTSTSFTDTSAALAVSETTVPATPMYARARADLETEADAEAEVRVNIQGQHGATGGEPAAGGDGETVTTEWTQIPQAFRAGFANVQVRSSPAEWSDYAFESTFTVESEQVGFVFRAQDGDNFYMWQLADESHGFDQDLLRPHVRANGSWEVLDPVPLGEYVDSVEGQEHHVRIEADGDQITTWLDGQEIDSRTDDTHASGVIGFRQPDHSTRTRSVLVGAITVTDVGGDVLFETDFEYDEPQYFDAGEIVDGQLRLANTDLTLLTQSAPEVGITDATLELGYEDPTAFEETVAPRGSDGADTKPLAHTVTFDATGLQEEAPVTADTGEYEDTPTSLDIDRATPATPVAARVTTRMEPYGDVIGLEGASWIWYPDDDPAWDVNESWAEGVRYFRRSFDLAEAPSQAEFVLTADNLATVYVNGVEVGTSADGFDGQPRYSWEHAPVLDVTDALEAGENTIAIEVERFGHYAGLIGRLEADVGDNTVTIDTDGHWLAADEVPENWTKPAFDDGDWPNAQVNGEYGMSPWGTNVVVDTGLESAVRLAMTDADGETTEYSEPVTTEGRQIRTTGWQPVAPAFNDGTVTLQAKDTRITAVTLELAVRNEI